MTTRATATTTADEKEGGSNTPQELTAQIAEYTSQLAGIEELLQATPQDEALLALHKDLVELLELTKNSIVSETSESSALSSSSSLSVVVADWSGGNVGDDRPPPPLAMEHAVGVPTGAAEASMMDDYAAPIVASITTTVDSDKKKTKKLKEFVVPPHLIVNQETDSEADKKRKRI
jgi:hypothetical protein